MDNSKFPVIEVSLVLFSKETETKKMTELLQVTPNKERGIEDWPNVIKSNKNLPEQIRPRNEWIWSIEFERQTSVDEALRSLINKFRDKTPNIFELYEKYFVECTVVVVIHADSVSMPEVSLEVETIEFLNAIKAPISFDIYTY